MKCMISVDNKHIQRVTEEKATELYHEGWRYIPKSVWKEKVRDLDKPKEEETTTKSKTNKLSKAQKRHMRKSK